MSRKSKLRKVYTDKGVFYYKIKLSPIYDDFFLYEKNERKLNILGFKIKLPPTYNIIPSGKYDGSWWLNKKGNRIENIKSLIKKILDEREDFDPDWDGVIFSKNKAEMRDVLINIILDDEEKEKLKS